MQEIAEIKTKTKGEKMTLKIKNRDIVVPGELLGTGDLLLGEGTYKRGKNVHSNILGLVDSKENFIKVIALNGRYIPKPKDVVIGVVKDISFSHWSLDLNSAYGGVLTVANGTDYFVNLDDEDISKIYGIGDAIVAKILNVSKAMNAGLTMKDRGLYKLSGGRIITITSTKVPRVIGRKGTMVQMIKDMTGCKITVGQNGRVWISGDNEELAVEAIKLIESKAHTPGLTENIRKFLEKSTGNKSSLKPKPVGSKEPEAESVESKEPEAEESKEAEE
ncbi:TPA: KH domain-containing protein [archaeon]|uniref:Exosome complex component Rrp4 n=1 Tax=Candidatus Undinarchaeum marinum TaxID=2756141 RepID=A0A832XFN2_9ARCH|nr:KH domain-containing protein [Candidatus Undinarchaeum marinum]